MDQSGNLVIGSITGYRVRVVAAASGRFYGRAMTAGDVYTVAGTAGSATRGTAAWPPRREMAAPQGVSVDRSGNLVIGAVDNDVIREVAASNGNFYGQAMTAGGIYTVAGDGQIGFSGDGGPAVSGSLFFPSAVGADGAGRLLIADNFNNRVRLVSQP